MAKQPVPMEDSPPKATEKSPKLFRITVKEKNEKHGFMPGTEYIVPESIVGELGGIVVDKKELPDSAVNPIPTEKDQNS